MGEVPLYPTCLTALTSFLPAYLPTYLPTHLPTFLSTYLPTYYLPTSIPVLSSAESGGWGWDSQPPNPVRSPKPNPNLPTQSAAVGVCREVGHRVPDPGNGVGLRTSVLNTKKAETRNLVRKSN